MKKNTTILSVMFLVLVSFSSFIPKSSGNFNLATTAGDLYVENNTDEELTQVDFISGANTVTFSNIHPFGGVSTGALDVDLRSDLVVEMYFNVVPAKGAVASFYNDGTLVGTINIAPGVNTFTIPAPVYSSGLLVFVDPA